MKDPSSKIPKASLVTIKTGNLKKDIDKRLDILTSIKNISKKNRNYRVAKSLPRLAENKVVDLEKERLKEQEKAAKIYRSESRRLEFRQREFLSTASSFFRGKSHFGNIFTQSKMIANENI